jgi:hypothetical protein
VNRAISRGQLRGPVRAGVSAHEIAADVVAPMKPEGVVNWRAPVASADPSRARRRRDPWRRPAEPPASAAD